MLTVNLGESLRRAMDGSGETLYRIAKDSGVDYAIVHKFYHRERDMKLETASRIVEHLGLELRPKGKRRRARRSRSEGEPRG
jgi:hypothetical protein